MAFIQILDGNGHWIASCSGTLVSSNVVLTAGHCTRDETTGLPWSAAEYRVVTGAVDWSDTADRHVSGVSQVLVNPSFNPDGPQHDAALLVLSSPVSQAPIPLWASGELYGGTGAVMAGWGLVAAGDSGLDTTQLQWAPTVVQSATYCSQAFYPSYPYDSSSDLCSINPPAYDTTACRGDSGGPALAQEASGQWIEIGIISVSAADCNTQMPAYFAAVLPIESWITAEARAVAPSSSSTSPPASSGGAGAPSSGSAAGGSGSQPTETGSTTPTGRLSSMSFPDARYYVRQVAAHFRGSIRVHALRFACSRVSSIRVRCNVNFWSGPNDYYGNVAVYYLAGPNGKTLWSDHYNFKWVNDHCYFHTNHRRSCRTNHRTGTY